MGGITCPECGLFNSATAERCDCGYQFSLKQVLPSLAHPSGGPQFVSVINIDMPFKSMVSFMVKWAIAAIPAFVILFGLGLIAVSLFRAITALLLGRPGLH